MTLNPDRLHAYLIAKREFYDADSPIGNRLVRELEVLCAEYVPENPPPGATRQ